MNNIATSNLLFYYLLPAKNSGRIRVVYLRNRFDGSLVIYSRKMRTDSLFLYLQNLKTILAQQWSHHFTGKYKSRTRLCCEPTQAISDNLQIVDLDLNSSVDREMRQCGLDHWYLNCRFIQRLGTLMPTRSQDFAFISSDQDSHIIDGPSRLFASHEKMSSLFSVINKTTM